jgi:transposase
MLSRLFFSNFFVLEMYREAHIERFYIPGPAAFLHVVRKLEGRIDDLEGQLIRQPQPVIKRLSQGLRRAHQTIARRTEELRQTHQLNHQLRQRIRELEQTLARGDSLPALPVTLDSHNSHQPPGSDPPWRKAKRTYSLREKTERPVGGQQGHPGATLRQSAQPHEVLTHRPSACSHCHAALSAATPGAARHRRQVWELMNGRLQVVEHQSAKLTCPACATVVAGRFPPGVRAPVQYGRSVLAVAVYLHLYQLLPVARTAEAMRDLFGCQLSWATIQGAAQDLSDKLLPCEQRLKGALAGSDVLGADETGLRVSGTGGYIHVARTEELTHYAYDSRRGKGAMDDIGILPRFEGTLVRDGFPSYQWYGKCRHSLCNAHLLRDLIFIGESYPAHKVWTEPFAKLLRDIKEALKQAAPERLPPAQQEAYRQGYAALLTQAEKLKSPAPPGVARTQLKPKTLIKRLQLKRDEVLRFMTDPAVPFDNNGSERDIRMVKLKQKISGCFRKEEGARRFCRIRSYLASARKQGYPLLPAIERAFHGKPLALHNINNTGVPATT